MDTISNPILFIGGGNMAHAIISGATHAGALDPSGVGVVEPVRDRHTLFASPFGSLPNAIAWLGEQSGSPVIVLAVKPQMLEAATAPLREHLAALPADPLVISILAGIRIARIELSLDYKARVIRVMPNTPAQIGLAMSAISASDQASAVDMAIAEGLFSSIGKAITIPEDLMDAFTAIAGSGPAYLFYLGEAMLQAALQLGFDKQQAQTLVRQTLLGSATLLDRSPEMPKALREKVTSKHGTTEAATNTLDEAGVMDALVRAIHAARHRGVELGKGDS